MFADILTVNKNLNVYCSNKNFNGSDLNCACADLVSKSCMRNLISEIGFEKIRN
jgi:hypothetical protein